MSNIEVTVTKPETKALERETRMMGHAARSIVIKTNGHYEDAAGELKGIKAKYKELDERRKRITKPLDAAKKEVMDLFRAPLAFLDKAEQAIKAKMLAYMTEQRKRQAAAEAEACKAQRLEQERLAKKAMEAAKQGDIEHAAMLQAEAETVPVAAPEVVAPKVAGTTIRETWEAEVTDKTQFLTAVITGKASLDLVDINMPKLNAIARSLKKDMNVPGVRAKIVRGMSARI